MINTDIRLFLHYLPAMYAPEFCDEKSVAEARKYFADNGGLLYVVSVLSERLDSEMKQQMEYHYNEFKQNVEKYRLED